MPGADDRWVTNVHEFANAVLKAAHKRGAKPLVTQILDIGNALRGDASVAVVGRRSFGKSRLLTALVGAEVTPSRTDVATSTYIQIEHGNGPACALACFRDPERPPEEIPLDQLADYAVVGGEHAGEIAYLRVLAGAPILREGIRLIDTPGLGGRDRAHEDVTLQVLEQADAVLMVIDAEQPITDDEREVLRRAREQVAHVLVVANKAEGEHAEQIAFNEQALGEPIVPASAMLAVEAAALEDPDAAAAVRAASGLDAVEDALKALAGAVRRDRYGVLLDRASAALEELERPDRELVDLAASGQDPAARLAELGEELERIMRLNPPNEINLRVGRLRQEVVDQYRAQVPPAFREVKERVGQQWDAGMAATLPVTCETATSRLWGEAATDVRRRARALAKELDRELDLGVKPRAALLALARSDGELLPETYQPGDVVPPPLAPSTGTEAAMRRGMRVMMAAGAGNLALAPLIPLAGVPGLNLVVIPMAVPLGLYMSRREEAALKDRATRQAALGYVTECQAGAAGLSAQLAARVTRFGEDLGRQYQQRWLARRETLTRTITQIRSSSAELEGARARLAELAPLLETRDALGGP